MVAWMGAMQAQEYAMAKWAIGLRVPKLKDSDVEEAFNEGRILRTHVLRPTWHFVTPADIRWMLALTAPRVLAFGASMFRKMELDNATFKRSNDILARALEGGRQLNRLSLKAELERSGIATDGLRFGFLLMHAELDGVICSGARQGKQFTYALLPERAPMARRLEKEEALAELTLRYFTSHGPATLQDFSWWSGLTIKEVRTGVALLKTKLILETIEGRQYLFAPSLPTLNFRPSLASTRLQSTFLMPDYDEYGIAYKDRSALFTIKNAHTSQMGITYAHMIVIDGVIGGTWQRTIENKAVAISTKPYAQLNKRKQQALVNAVKRYHRFVA